MIEIDIDDISFKLMNSDVDDLRDAQYRHLRTKIEQIQMREIQHSDRMQQFIDAESRVHDACRDIMTAEQFDAAF